MSDLKVGDKIFHKANASIVWIVENITENEVYCSTIIKESLEQKKEKFFITSIEKCADPKPFVAKKSRSNYW